MMLHIFLWKQVLHLLQLRKELQTVSSGVLAQTVLSAQTRTPPRSSATILTSTFRLTSSMTPRRPAVSPSAPAFRRQAHSAAPTTINQADFVACHNPAYIHMGMKMVQDVKPGGVFMINCQWSDEELGQHLNAEAKKYIADNNIQLYTINAIDKAIEIGMGKRTNTILQSAFFKLADVMPIEDAVNFMKQAAQKSYGKKGQDVVEMNWKAIDAGVDAIHKVDVPASWSNPEARSRSQGSHRPSGAGQADP